jgi:hypothetical protein
MLGCVINIKAAPVTGGLILARNPIINIVGANIIADQQTEPCYRNPISGRESAWI